MESAKTYMDALRDNLFETAIKNDWSMNQLAIQCGISYRTLYKIINRESGGLQFSVLIKISDGLEKPVPELISRRPKGQVSI